LSSVFTCLIKHVLLSVPVWTCGIAWRGITGAVNMINEYNASATVAADDAVGVWTNNSGAVIGTDGLV